MIQTVNIQARSNEPFYAEFLIREDGTPMKLAAVPLEMHVRHSADAGERVLVLSTDNGKLIGSNSDTANLVMSLSLAAIGAVPAGTYVHDLKVVGGRVLWSGTFTVVQGVTR